MTALKSVNVALVFVTFALAVSTSYVMKFYNEALFCSQIEKDNALCYLQTSSLVLSIASGLLFLMTLASFAMNSKLFLVVKSILCLVVFVSGIFVLGSSLRTGFLGKQKDSQKSPSIGIAAGVVSLFAVGSCSMTVFKMLVK